MRIGLDIGACSTLVSAPAGAGPRQPARLALGSASVAWLDEEDRLQLRPPSQARSHRDFALADALLLLGMVDGEDAAPGLLHPDLLPPDLLAAERAAEALRRRLGLGMLECAAAVRDRAVELLAAGLRPIARALAGQAAGLALAVDGAAGPALAAAIAEELGIAAIIVSAAPRGPSGRALEPRLRDVVFDRRPVPVPWLDRETLHAAGRGPAVIADALRATVVPPGWAWQVDGASELHLSRQRGA